MTDRKKTKRAPPKAPTIWDVDTYFDASFTRKERDDIQRKLMQICGYGPPSTGYRRGVGDYIGFEDQIVRPAEDVVWPAFKAHGFDYNRDGARMRDWAFIHICRELEIEYKSFAGNVPKLSIQPFIEHAKRAFPEFRRPKNRIEQTIQEHKLHAAWCDWHAEECPRTGCESDHHWICSDRFEDRDYAAILEQIAAHNETRPKFAPPRLVYSRPTNVRG